jgi:serine/threonine protein kinase
LPLQKALDYACQILNALDAAHQKGITHRDLKPANILITKQGIKLDFGLAKHTGPLKETDVTQALTQEGQLVGTLNYMSPEQLQSKDADPRSDIFSFGLVLYEMLTGKRAFAGSSAASIIAAILERPAPSMAVSAPALLDRLLRRYLAKDPDQRWQNARDLMLEIESLDNAQATPAPARSPWLPWLVAALALVAAGAAWLPWRKSSPLAASPTLRFTLETPGLKDPRGVALSPDGSKLAFAAAGIDGQRHSYFRLLDSDRDVVLADVPADSFPDLTWAPDSRSILYLDSFRAVRKVDLAGGAPQLVVAPNQAAHRDFTWASTGDILIARQAIPIDVVPHWGGPPFAWLPDQHGWSFGQNIHAARL